MSNSNLISRSIQTSLLIGAILFVFLSQKISLPILWGGTLGVTLSTLNLFLFFRLSETLHHKKKSLAYAGLKFPIFYGILIFFLSQFQFSVFAFMIGFSVPFFVIVLKTFGGFTVGKRTAIVRST
jgi:hypothetical protein